MGINWITSTVSALLYIIKNKHSWKFALLSLIVSQILIFTTWTDTMFGTWANIIILVPVFFSFLKILPNSYFSQFKKEALNRLSTSTEMPLLTDEEIKHLPLMVQKYIRYAGFIGKPKIQNFHASFKGQMRTSMKGGWLKVIGEQYNFYGNESLSDGNNEVSSRQGKIRDFYISSSLFGLPFEGFHLYKNSSAIMLIKVAGLFKVVDAKGEIMNKSETVTLFNDMCIIAPSTLIDKNIKWKVIDDLTVEATFTNAGNSIKANLYFNEKGELINFVSDDRCQSEDGKTYISYRWSTPVSDYEEINGIKLGSVGKAIWHDTPKGDFCYGNFNFYEVKYNCRDYCSLYSRGA